MENLEQMERAGLIFACTRADPECLRQIPVLGENVEGVNVRLDLSECWMDA